MEQRRRTEARTRNLRGGGEGSEAAPAGIFPPFICPSYQPHMLQASCQYKNVSEENNVN